VRITNVTDKVAKVTGTLLDSKGKLLGQSAAEWVIAPQATMVLSTAELAEKLAATPWDGKAHLVTTATTAVKLMATARINGVLIDLIDRIPEPPEPVATAQ